MAERLDKQELQRILKALKELAAPVMKLAGDTGILGRVEGRYEALKDIYGSYWFVPAYIYELLSLRPGSGYGPRVNVNPIGLLISFALKDSPASFWNMERVFRNLYLGRAS